MRSRNPLSHGNQQYELRFPHFSGAGLCGHRRYLARGCGAVRAAAQAGAGAGPGQCRVCRGRCADARLQRAGHRRVCALLLSGAPHRAVAAFLPGRAVPHPIGLDDADPAGG